MQLDWPEFSDGFLATVLAGVARRRRAIRRQGDLKVWFPQAGDRLEWCALSLEVAARRAVLLSLWPRNRASLRVLSTWNRDRGRLLFELPELRLPADAPRIVGALEATVHLVAGGDEPDIFMGAAELLWRALEMRAV